MSRRLRDAAWIGGGVALSAIGTLAGVSLLTEAMLPTEFGRLSLLLAASVLATQIGASPIAQAAIHLYPGFMSPTRVSLLRAHVTNAHRRNHLIVAILLMVVGGLGVTFERSTWWDVVLVLLLFTADSSRTLHLSAMNAERRHALYSLWVALDAWARPLAALGAMAAVGSDASVALSAHVMVAGTLNLLFGRWAWRGLPRHDATMPAANVSSDNEPKWIDRTIVEYSLPLVPLALCAWTVNMGDRFAIGTILDEAAVGLYSAAYGLSAAPFMMLAGMVEQAIRPPYQQAVMARNHVHADRLLRIWLLTVAAAACTGWALFLIAHKLIATWALGPAFSAAATLMPWIAGGYALRATASVFERVCYGYARTRRVLAIHATTAATAVATIPIAAAVAGLRAAAASLVLVFAVQLALAAFLAVRTRGESPVAESGEVAV